MKSIKKAFFVFLILNLFIGACSVAPPQSVGWTDPNATPKVALNNPIIQSPEPLLSQDPLFFLKPKPLPTGHILPKIEIKPFCDGNSQHECYGDFQNGWRGVYSTDYNLVFVEYFIMEKKIAISESNGKYWLSCSGVGGDQKEVTAGFIKNLREKIETLRQKIEAFENTTQNNASGVGWTLLGGAISCVAGIVIVVIFPPADGVTVPVAAGACGITGSVGGTVTAIGQGGGQVSRAQDELTKAQDDIQKFLQQVCP
jgi:hypothetical protein